VLSGGGGEGGGAWKAREDLENNLGAREVPEGGGGSGGAAGGVEEALDRLRWAAPAISNP